MTNVVGFPPPKQDQPDSAHACVIAKDGKPEKWFQFSVAFEADGSEFTFEIWALDEADAQRRVSLIRDTARLQGQIFGTAPY